MPLDLDLVSQTGVVGTQNNELQYSVLVTQVLLQHVTYPSSPLQILVSVPPQLLAFQQSDCTG